ncbi:MAG: single-stranded DNA-binding protein [Bacteroidales bacterium]|nr:single-stranded DNA-binding protein [Bacteroidales bacterium]
MSVNKVILVGHVGQDPEVRYLDNNTPVCTIRMATSDVYKNKSGERVTTTEWHNVVLWRGLAEVADKYVKKGSQIYIEGKLRTRSYEDKDKNKKYVTEIVADVMQLLGKRNDDAGNATQSQDTQAPAATEDKVQADEPDITNDLPF